MVLEEGCDWLWAGAAVPLTASLCVWLCVCVCVCVCVCTWMYPQRPHPPRHLAWLGHRRRFSGCPGLSLCYWPNHIYICMPAPKQPYIHIHI